MMDDHHAFSGGPPPDEGGVERVDYQIPIGGGSFNGAAKLPERDRQLKEPIAGLGADDGMFGDRRAVPQNLEDLTLIGSSPAPAGIIDDRDPGTVGSYRRQTLACLRNVSDLIRFVGGLAIRIPLLISLTAHVPRCRLTDQ